jgi:hypothetical protein
MTRTLTAAAFLATLTIPVAHAETPSAVLQSLPALPRKSNRTSAHKHIGMWAGKRGRMRERTRSHNSQERSSHGRLEFLESTNEGGRSAFIRTKKPHSRAADGVSWVKIPG